jgi:hypothetical protein
MKIVQMKLMHGATSIYSQSQVIVWLCARQTSSRPSAVQQNTLARENRNSVTELNASVPSAESVQTHQWTIDVSIQGC